MPSNAVLKRSPEILHQQQQLRNKKIFSVGLLHNRHQCSLKLLDMHLAAVIPMK